MLAGGALEAGQVGGHCQPQPVSEWCRGIAGHEGQFGGIRHTLTVRLHWTFGQAPILHLAAATAGLSGLGAAGETREYI